LFVFLFYVHVQQLPHWRSCSVGPIVWWLLGPHAWKG